MVVDKRWDGFVSVRAALSLPVAPLHYIVSWPTQFLKIIISKRYYNLVVK
jgi:hypothetical protein